MRYDTATKRVVAGMGVLVMMSVAQGTAGEQVSIGNATLRASVDRDSGVFSLAPVEVDADAWLIGADLGGAGAVVSCDRVAVEDGRWGAGSAVRIVDPAGNQSQISLFADLPFAVLQRTLVNRGAAEQRVAKVPMLAGCVQLGIALEQLTTMSTAGLRGVTDTPGSYSFLSMADPVSRRGVVCGFLTHARGTGIVFAAAEDDVPRLRARIDYGDLRLAPGAQAVTETLVIGCFDDVRVGLEAYGDAVARQLEIELPEQPVVYCTWYHAGASDEKRIAATAAFVREDLVPYGFSVMQIDDKWQLGTKANGPRRNFTAARPDGPYPNGMKPTADQLRELGLVPGIWFMPFAGTWSDPLFADRQHLFYQKDGKPYEVRWGGTCLDMTCPEAREFLRDIVHRIAHDWGYKYFKMDGLWTGTGTQLLYVNSFYKDDDLGEATRHDPAITPIEAYRSGLELVRDTAGDDVFFLGCCANQNMRSFGPTFGLVDAMRVGPDNGARPEAMARGPTFAGRVFFLNGRVWYNDPDPVYVRPSFPAQMAQTMVSWTAVTGTLHSSSYDYGQLPPERLRILQRSMPSHGLLTVRPVDYLENDPAQVWHLWDDTRGVRRDIVALFNWDVGASAVVKVGADRLDLPRAQTYVGFDYWADRFVPPFSGQIASSLLPGGCAVLSLRPAAGSPQVVGTSRHVTQGVIDLLDEQWDPGAAVLRGRSRVVANDPYELRIVVPVGEASWQADAVTVTGGVAATATVTQAGPTVRVPIVPTATGEVEWAITWRRAAVTAPRIDQVEDVTAKATPWAVRLSWQEQPSAVGYRVTKHSTGEPARFELAKAFMQDQNVEYGAQYRYSVQARSWDGTWSNASDVSVQMPARPERPADPPEPDVACTTLKPVRASCGWGKLHVGESVMGKTLHIDGKPYSDGIGTHAPSTIVYRIPKGARRFVSIVGLDDAKKTDARSSVVFRVIGDVKEMGEPPVVLGESPVLANSGELRAWAFDIELDERLRELQLVVTDADDGKAADHADWVDVGFLTK